MGMDVSPLAGKPAPAQLLVDIPALVAAYYTERPDPSVPAERVAFGTSGHRGSSLERSFNEDHVLAISEAICRYRKGQGIDGPLFLGFDTHALSEPAFRSALEVLAANEVDVMIDARRDYTPTPVLSHAILTHNRGRTTGLADGLIITPSHNPPEDGGIKYNPPSGGPADETTTKWIEARANELLAAGLRGVHRVALPEALARASQGDFVRPYVDDLLSIVDLEAVRAAGLRIGVDPLGGAALPVYEALAARGIGLTVVNPVIDPTFAFMPPDHDGKIRMDCS